MFDSFNKLSNSIRGYVTYSGYTPKGVAERIARVELISLSGRVLIYFLDEPERDQNLVDYDRDTYTFYAYKD